MVRKSISMEYWWVCIVGYSQIIAVVERAGQGRFDMSNKFLLIVKSALAHVFQIVGFEKYLKFLLVLETCGGLYRELVSGFLLGIAVSIIEPLGVSYVFLPSIRSQ